MKEIRAEKNNKDIIIFYLKMVDVSGFLIIFWLLIGYIIIFEKKNLCYSDLRKILMLLISILFSIAILFRTIFMTIGQVFKKLNISERMREEWIEDVSHDLKIPLSTIRGYAEIMQEESYEFTDDELYYYASEIKQAEQRIEDMVAEMKIIQNLSEGKIQLKKEKVNIGELIQECINEISSELIGKSKMIYSNNEDVYLYCDRKLIKRSFENIMQNAFIHNNKPIILSISVRKFDRKISICIKDTGKGISEEDIKHIFERYYRGKGTKGIKGQGLGLSITYEIIKIHKGSIKVKSKKNKGTEFSIELS